VALGDRGKLLRGKRSGLCARRRRDLAPEFRLREAEPGKLVYQRGGDTITIDT